MASTFTDKFITAGATQTQLYIAPAATTSVVFGGTISNKDVTLKSQYNITLERKAAVAVVTASISTTVMTITVAGAANIAVGDVISGAGVTVGTTIVSFGTGTGGTGTYNVSVSQTVSSTAITCSRFISLLNGVPIQYGQSLKLPKIVVKTGEELYATASTAGVLDIDIAVLERT